MGDFVSREHLPDDDLPTQNLFSWTETEKPGEDLQSIISQEQNNNRDFSLYITTAYKEELPDILQQE
jgi:hypothetical protein